MVEVVLYSDDDRDPVPAKDQFNKPSQLYIGWQDRPECCINDGSSDARLQSGQKNLKFRSSYVTEGKTPVFYLSTWIHRRRPCCACWCGASLPLPSYSSSSLVPPFHSNFNQPQPPHHYYLLLSYTSSHLHCLLVSLIHSSATTVQQQQHHWKITIIIVIIDRT